MIKVLIALCICCSFMAGSVTGANAEERIRVNLNNRSNQAVYMIAYDPICRIRVFEAVLGNNGSTTVRVCSDNKRRGRIVVYDRRGRSLKFSGIHDGSGVNIRFR